MEKLLIIFPLILLYYLLYKRDMGKKLSILLAIILSIIFIPSIIILFIYPIFAREMTLAQRLMSLIFSIICVFGYYIIIKNLKDNKDEDK